MNKIFYAIAILSSIIMLGGCSKDNDGGNNDSDEPTPPEENGGTVISPTNDFTIYKPDSVGTATKPADWVAISDIDPTSLMLITIDNKHMPATVIDEDLLTAFVGNECRSVVSPSVDSDDKVRFSMVVNQCADEDCGAGQNVQLRYYSASKHRIFISETFKYQPGAILGSTKESYHVNWR